MQKNLRARDMLSCFDALFNSPAMLRYLKIRKSQTHNGLKSQTELQREEILLKKSLGFSAVKNGVVSSEEYI